MYDVSRCHLMQYINLICVYVTTNIKWFRLMATTMAPYKTTFLSANNYICNQCTHSRRVIKSRQSDILIMFPRWFMARGSHNTAIACDLKVIWSSQMMTRKHGLCVPATETGMNACMHLCSCVLSLPRGYARACARMCFHSVTACYSWLRDTYENSRQIQARQYLRLSLQDQQLGETLLPVQQLSGTWSYLPFYTFYIFTLELLKDIRAVCRSSCKSFEVILQKDTLFISIESVQET